MLMRFGLWDSLAKCADVATCEQLGYFAFQALLKNCSLVLTDSGGVQEEAAVWGVPTLTLAGRTARTITVRHGTNQVVGKQKSVIIHHAERILKNPPLEDPGARIGGELAAAFWDGRTSARIAEKLIAHLNVG